MYPSLGTPALAHESAKHLYNVGCHDKVRFTTRNSPPDTVPLQSRFRYQLSRI